MSTLWSTKNDKLLKVLTKFFKVHYHKVKYNLCQSSDRKIVYFDNKYLQKNCNWNQQLEKHCFNHFFWLILPINCSRASISIVKYSLSDNKLSLLRSSRKFWQWAKEKCRLMRQFVLKRHFVYFVVPNEMLHIFQLIIPFELHVNTFKVGYVSSSNFISH